MQKGNILIVDDSPENLQILSDMLLNAEYRIRAAKGGILGLKAIEVNKPDLILLDIKMPDMDGYQVCRQIKQNKETQNIPVIFITGKTDFESEKKGFEVGAVDYIIKPFNPAVVLARVKTHLALKFARKSLENQNEYLEQKVKERTQQLQDMLNEKNVLLREIHHRVKNNLQLLSALLFLQLEKYSGQIRDILQEYQNRLHSLAIIHNNLYLSKNFMKVDLVKFIRDLKEHFKESNNPKGIEFTINSNMDTFVIDINYAIPCSLVINELISNCVKHAFNNQQTNILDINLTKNESNIYSLTISDNGPGFPEDFDPENLSTWGLCLVNIVKEQLHGAVKYNNNNGASITFTFSETIQRTYNEISNDS